MFSESFFLLVLWAVVDMLLSGWCLGVFYMSDEKLVSLLKECGALQFGRFVLTSGAVSNYYVDIKKASTDPVVLRYIGELMAGFVDGYDLVAGMELGAVPLAVAVALESDVPFVIVRKGEREHGLKRLIEGSDVSGKRVLVVEDVTTSGGSVVKAVERLRDAGASVDCAVVVVDREGDARRRLEELDVSLESLVSVSDILKDVEE